MLEDPKTCRKHDNTKRKQIRMKKPKVLALITARGGSKGLPRKNILPLGGKPLIAWTIEAAQQSGIADQIVLSSDDNEIIKVAETWGCSVPFKRPSVLASDIASSVDVVMHTLDQLPGFDYIVLLQPTSPLRNAEDIKNAFNALLEAKAKSCISVTEVEQSPYWMYLEDNESRLVKLIHKPDVPTRRQDLPKVYIPNGAIYISEIKELIKNKTFIGNNCIAYKMTAESSIDIDCAKDFKKAEQMIIANQKNANR